jgi:DNA repair protein SbcC/Rad50
MRILSVKGKNLASLDDDFFIDFEKGALGRAGLFAITGPTGSGKSTILDAICVALFDKTPRLSDSGGALIGRTGDEDRLGSNDVRSLLRRGAGSGYAEVAFVGRDGQSYLSKWTVRKARGLATGKFQAQNMELRNLATGQGLGGTKTETLKLIQELVGLTYEQFCRSVLLAQGDFAAFLKADEKERSALLERITGTQIYGRLSMAAFRRMKDETQLLADLERQQGDIVLLDDQQRQAEQEGLQAIGVSLQGVLEKIALAHKAGDWYQQRRALQEGVQVASLKHTEAEQSCQGAEALRLELAAAEQAQPLRSLVLEADGARERVVEAERAVQQQAQVKAEAHELRDAGRRSLEEARAAAAVAESNLADARPLIAKASQLDVRIKDAVSLSEKARGQAESARGGVAAALKDLERMQSDGKALAAQVTAADAWFASHELIAPLAAQWERWHQELQHFLKGSRRCNDLSAVRLTLLDEEERTLREVERSGQVLAAALKQEASAKLARDNSEQRAAAIDTASLTKERVEQEGRRDVLKALRQLNREVDADLAEQQRVCAGGQEATEGAAKALSEWQKALRDRESIESALQEAERALIGARAAQSLEQQRANLTKGESCPLCGSKDHPWAAGSPVAGLLKSQELRVAELGRSKTSLEKAEASGRERETHLLSQAASLALKEEAFGRELGEKQLAWEELYQRGSDIDLPLSAAGAEAAGRVTVALAAVEQALETILAREKSAQELDAASRKCRESYDAAVNERERVAQAQGVAEKSHREVADQLKIAQLDLTNAEREVAQVLITLAEPFATREGWEARLKAGPQEFIARSEAEVKEWGTWTRKHDEGKKALAELELGIEGGRVRLDGLRRDEKEKNAGLESQEHTVATLRVERAAFFEGRLAAKVEEELTGKQKGAHASLETAREEDSRRERACAGATAALDKVSERLLQLSEAAQVALASLASELVSQGLSEEILRQRLSHDHLWVTRQRELLARLDSAAHAAKTVMEERRRALAQHEEAGVPALEEASVPLEREAAGAEKVTLEQQQFDIRHRLEVDDAAKKKNAELLPQINAQFRKTDLWRKISEVIGSADGKKFRTYAQSLTLEVLLGYANEHLKSLAPRYAVIRVPSSEMELQMVDRDMGDEVRSVNSLSGGEGFLVSLALALGLSSLSSHTTRVESLFIDEGFGSLDPDTLEVALATLDSLQASGRKVGIISHVPGLAERIGVRIEVSPGGGGRSKVRVLGV